MYGVTPRNCQVYSYALLMQEAATKKKAPKAVKAKAEPKPKAEPKKRGRAPAKKDEKKKRAKKDKNAPKKGLSAFMFFSNATRDEVGLSALVSHLSVLTLAMGPTCVQ